MGLKAPNAGKLLGMESMTGWKSDPKEILHVGSRFTRWPFCAVAPSFLVFERTRTWGITQDIDTTPREGHFQGGQLPFDGHRRTLQPPRICQNFTSTTSTTRHGISLERIEDWESLPEGMIF